MAREIKTWEHVCASCGKTVIVKAASEPELPKGWKVVPVHNCGMTGYTRYEDRCPACKKK